MTRWKQGRIGGYEVNTGKLRQDGAAWKPKMKQRRNQGGGKRRTGEEGRTCKKEGGVERTKIRITGCRDGKEGRVDLRMEEIT